MPCLAQDWDADESECFCGIFLATSCLGIAEISQDGIWGTALFPHFDYCDYKVSHQDEISMKNVLQGAVFITAAL
jgi:hypothetical protein